LDLQKNSISGKLFWKNCKCNEYRKKGHLSLFSFYIYKEELLASFPNHKLELHHYYYQFEENNTWNLKRLIEENIV